MNLRYEELLDYVEPPEQLVEPLSPASQERIFELTMKKINESKTRRKISAPFRWLMAAVVLILILCITAFAAVENGWFGFDRIFGEQVKMAEDGMTNYTPQEAPPVMPRAYTGQEQDLMQEGLMPVPEQAELASSGVSAFTEDFQFTLEQMLAGEDVLCAILRVDARNETAQAVLSNATGDLETERRFRVSALANTGDNFREKEMNNGAISMEQLSVAGSVGYFLVSNTGGQFAEGDPILFQFYSDKGSTDLFVVPLGPLTNSKAVVELDPSVYEGKGYQQESMTVTPIYLEINGTYTVSPDGSCSVVVITLKDGTSFELANIGNGFQHTPYGQYGSLVSAGTASGPESGGTVMRETWTFSKAIDLDQIGTITVDGIDYTLDLLQN